MTTPHNSELVFDVIEEADGGFVAECRSENIVTEGDTWEELRAHVKEAVEAFFLMVQNRKQFGFTWLRTKFS